MAIDFPLKSKAPAPTARDKAADACEQIADATWRNGNCSVAELEAAQKTLSEAIELAKSEADSAAVRRQIAGV